MAKDKQPDLLSQVLARTEANVVKKRGGSGKVTYLDRFVQVLTDDEGNPTEPKTRTQIIAEMSLAIIQEKIEGREEPFTLTEAGDGEDDLLLAEVNKKCKNQVASAIANNQNSTSISYNENYKDKWQVVKHEGSKVSLAPVSAE
jgi:hypothetical protein